MHFSQMNFPLTIYKRLNDTFLSAAPCTPAEEDMLRHKIQFKWRSAEKLYVKSGGMIEFSCRRGFHPDPSSPPFRVQCIEGKLEYPKCTRTYVANHPK